MVTARKANGFVPKDIRNILNLFRFKFKVIFSQMNLVLNASA